MGEPHSENGVAASLEESLEDVVASSDSL